MRVSVVIGVSCALRSFLSFRLMVTVSGCRINVVGNPPSSYGICSLSQQMSKANAESLGYYACVSVQ